MYIQTYFRNYSPCWIASKLYCKCENLKAVHHRFGGVFKFGPKVNFFCDWSRDAVYRAEFVHRHCKNDARNTLHSPHHMR